MLSVADTLDRRRFYRKSAGREKEKSLGMKRRVEISVETTRVMVITRTKERRATWCAACGAEVQMLTIDEAAALSGASPRTIFHLLEGREIHFSELPGGPILICPNSLPK